MTIDGLKIFLNNTCLDISEHTKRLFLIFCSQIPEDMQLGDIIFLCIFGLLSVSIVLSALSKVKLNQKVGLENYYLDKILVQSKKKNKKQ